MIRAAFLREVRTLERAAGVDPLPEPEIDAGYIAYLRETIDRIEEQAARHWHGWPEDPQ